MKLKILALAAVFVSLSPAVRADVVTRGEALSPKPAKPVDMCIRESKVLAGKTVKVTGKVKQVCQAKGCWFALESKDGQTVRVTSMGYKFFVPMNAAGKTATVEGVFGVKELSSEMAQHYENDRVAGSAEQPRKITSPVKEYSLAATAVELH